MSWHLLSALATLGLISGVAQGQPAAAAAAATAPTAAATTTASTASTAAATVQQPRPFGYAVGDLLTQRVLLESEGRSLEPAVLPIEGRTGAWFERRSSNIQTLADGRRWLSVEYQVINAPLALTTVRLPAWELKTKSAGTVLRIPTWEVSVGPLTVPRVPSASASDAASDATVAAESGAPSDSAASRPPESQTASTAGSADLRPDSPAPKIPTAPIRQRLLLWSAATVVVLAAWLGWLLWRNHLTASRRPFALAYRELQHVEESAPESWQALHRAFDRTAGRVVQPESMAALFLRAPYLEPLRAQIEQFFAASSERFFGDGPSHYAGSANSTQPNAAPIGAASTTPVPPNPVSPRALSSLLRALEKRHER